MQVIAITGATGAVGRHLVQKITGNDFEIRVLVHQKNNDFNDKNIKIIEGDLLKKETLSELVVPGCTTVVNLVYLQDQSFEKNLTAIMNLVETCIKAKAKRLIHCSTAVVIGKCNDNIVSEDTVCKPMNEYEVNKYEIENVLLSKYSDQIEVVILRPTAVFGPDCHNLLKLADNLRQGKRVVNYLKSCLYNKRKMNLVYVDNVVAALDFLIHANENVNGEKFIISDDDSPINNYRLIEKYLMKRFGICDYRFPFIPLPLFFLAVLLKFTGKSNYNPNCIYNCQKLLDKGFVKPVLFEEGLNLFSDWYQDKHF